MKLVLQVLFAVPVVIVLLSIIGMKNDWYVHLSVGFTAAMISSVFVNSTFY